MGGSARVLGRSRVAFGASFVVLVIAAVLLLLVGREPVGEPAAMAPQGALLPSAADLPLGLDPFASGLPEVPFDVTPELAPAPEVVAAAPVVAAVVAAAQPAAAATAPPVPKPLQTAPAATGPVRGDSTVVYAGSAVERGRAALASLPFPYRELGVTVVFRPYRGGLLGRYDPIPRRLTVYVSPTQTRQGLRVTIAHELGHALDAAVNTWAVRRDYLAARGLPRSTPWLPCLTCSDYASGAGDFAEVFALSVAGRGDFRSRLAGEPSAARLAALAPFFRPPSQRAPAQAATGPATPTRAPAPVPAPPASGPAPAPTPTRCGLVDALLGCRTHR